MSDVYTHNTALNNVGILIEYIEENLSNEFIVRADVGDGGIVEVSLDDADWAEGFSVIYKGSDDVRDLLEIGALINRYISEEYDGILHVGDTPIFLQVKLYKDEPDEDDEWFLNYIAAIGNLNMVDSPVCGENTEDEYCFSMRYIDIALCEYFKLSSFKDYDIDFRRIQLNFAVEIDDISVLLNMDGLKSVYICDSVELISEKAERYEEIRVPLEEKGISYDYFDNRV